MKNKEDIQIQRIKKSFLINFKDIIDGKIDENSDENEQVFYSRCISAMTLMHLTGIDYKSAGNYITDGFNDYGLDCIYIDDYSKKVILIQSKMNNDGIKAPSKSDMLKFVEGVEKILYLDFSGFNNKIQKMQRVLETAISDVDYSIEMVLSYTGSQKTSKECTDVILNFEKKINDGINEDNKLIKHKIFNKSKIYEMILETSKVKEIDVENFSIQNWGLMKDGEITTGYYGIVDASEIAELWNEHRIQLFEKNIRFFKGDSLVNSGIIEVLINEPNNFLYYNNGIKIVAKEVKRKLVKSGNREIGQFSLKDISIVNGAQTVGCIGQVYSINPNYLKNAKLFVTIISLENQGENYENRITKLSNTQNKIDSKDFIGLDPEQERIKKEFLAIGFEYIYKDGSYYYESKDRIYVDEITIAVGCYLDEVEYSTIIKRAIGSVYNDLTKKPYSLIFNSSISIEKILNIVKVYRICEEYIKNKSKNIIGDQKMILIHGNRFLLHMLFYKLKEEKIDLETEMPAEEKIYELIDYLLYVIEDASKEEFKYVYPANLFKNSTICTDIKNRICDNINSLYKNIVIITEKYEGNSMEQMNLFTV